MRGMEGPRGHRQRWEAQPGGWGEGVGDKESIDSGEGAGIGRTPQDDREAGKGSGVHRHHQICLSETAVAGKGLTPKWARAGRLPQWPRRRPRPHGDSSCAGRAARGHPPDTVTH